MIDLQHILHGTYEAGALLGRDEPALFQPGLELGFFGDRRSPSGGAKTVRKQSVLVDVSVGPLNGEQAIATKDGALFLL